MRVVNVTPYPKRNCNAPRKCEGEARHIVTIEPNDKRYQYKTYALCDECKDRALQASAS